MIRETGGVLPEKERCHSQQIETTSARDMIFYVLGLVLQFLIMLVIYVVYVLCGISYFSN